MDDRIIAKTQEMAAEERKLEDYLLGCMGTAPFCGVFRV